MKRRLNDSGPPCETLLNTASYSPCSSPPVRSVISIVNVPYSQPNNVNHTSLGRISPSFNYSSTMPSLTIHEKSATATVALALTSHHNMNVPAKCKPHNVTANNTGQNPQQFQRLKVEDALSYLDQVKFKFSTQPNIYNDFLDIMKEFKAQSIDTPGVITRVSNLFKGYPELISGFNTFLPPGYKIEVQSNDSGYSFQVSVCIPSPASSSSTVTNLIPTQTVHYTTCGITATTTAGSDVIAGPQLINPPMIAKSYPVSNSTNPCCIVPSTNPSPSTNVTTTTITTQVNNAIHKPVLQSASGHSFNQAQAHHAVSQALINVESGGSTAMPIQQNQPVEFNHAINYVNKIKSRFLAQPDKYKKFLEILHTYQKEQRTMKENQQAVERTLTEAQVYSQVAKLFENQDDLLAEFGQFLPDATSHQANFGIRNVEYNAAHISKKSSLCSSKSYVSANSTPTTAIPNNNSGSSVICHMNNNISSSCSNNNLTNISNSVGSSQTAIVHNNNLANSATNSSSVASSKYPVINNMQPTGLISNSSQKKRSSSFSTAHTDSSFQPPIKKHKNPCLRDVTLAEANMHCNLKEFEFFERIRKSIRDHDIYRNFLRCLYIYNYEIINRSELLMLTSPFLTFYPDVYHWFKEFIGQPEMPASVNSSSTVHNSSTTLSDESRLPNMQRYQILETSSADTSTTTVVSSRQEKNLMDIDYSTCKRIGASYCAVPDDFVPPKCSGRSARCKELLNDIWVSFPTWSEDSTFVSSRKTQYEECIYRCEDERFELDVVIESNLDTIRNLEAVQKKLNNLSPEEASKFILDDCLGGRSETIHTKSISRIYGEKAPDVIEGLKTAPALTVPVVLNRLKVKDAEWREAQKGFNKIWREQNEKFYLKSLDHQGINFKQNDGKYLKPKSLANEIQTLFDERQKHVDENHQESQGGPHLVLPYCDKSVIDDAANLLIHHAKRQTAINKEEKYKIKCLLRRFLPDLFHHPRQEFSDDEKDDSDSSSSVDMFKKRSDSQKNNKSIVTTLDSRLAVAAANAPKFDEYENSDKENAAEYSSSNAESEDIQIPVRVMSVHPNEEYTLIFGDIHWYYFFRLHQILCDRLGKMNERARLICRQELLSKENGKESASIALRLKPKPEIEVEDYYPALLDMVKNLLDGNLDSTTYEDTLREMFGIHAYLAFTMDKVVSIAVRQLQSLVTMECCQQCYDLFTIETKKNATGGRCLTSYQRELMEAGYQKKVETLDLDSCFKIFIYKINCKITIECIDSDGENCDQENNDAGVDTDNIVTDKYSSVTRNDIPIETTDK